MKDMEIYICNENILSTIVSFISVKDMLAVISSTQMSA